MFKFILICGLIGSLSAHYDHYSGDMSHYGGGMDQYGGGSQYEAIPLPDGIVAGIMDSPFYDCKTRSVYFIGLFTPYVFRYSEDDNRIYYFILPDNLRAGFFIPSRSDPYTFVGGFNNTVYTIKWDLYSKQCQVLGQLFTAPLGTNPNMNYAVAGPKGALYTGTVDRMALCGAAPTQGFYRYTRKRGLEVLPGRYKTTNSLAFDYKRSILYHLDGCTQQLIAFKICTKTGAICGQWVVLNNFGIPSSGAPVGIVILPNGDLLISSYKFGKLLTVETSGKGPGRIVDQMDLPTFYAAAIAVGGRAMDTLYLLTASLDADIMTGQPNNVTVPPPGGQFIIMRNFGRGRRVKKPCLICSS